MFVAHVRFPKDEKYQQSINIRETENILRENSFQTIRSDKKHILVDLELSNLKRNNSS